MNYKLKIYAPVDCEVYPLKELNDGVFSEGMLGVGLYIIPQKNKFKSFLDNAKVAMVFDTKHAIFLEDEESGIQVLMHIGLDTVTLQGEPFTLHVSAKDQISLTNNLIDVDLTEIKSKNISTATPIVIEENMVESFKLVKQGQVKQGELIAEFEILKSVVSQTTVSKVDQMPVSFKDDYEVAVEQIKAAIGSQANVTKYYNCMTRFRVIVENKDLVDLQKIKKIKVIKGIVWNGNELQMIVGGDVYKVTEAYKKSLINEVEQKNNFKGTKKSWKDKIMGAITGIIIPALPAMIVAGLLQAIQSILVQTNVIESVRLNYHGGPNNPVVLLDNYTLPTAIIYILSQTGLSFVGIFFCYNAVKYFDGNPIMGIFIGLTLASPYLFGDVSFTLFNIGKTAIQVKAYPTSILPQVVAGIIAVYLDRWIKNWMPTSVDVIFRNALTYIITVLSIFFLLGPILGFAETGVYYICSGFEKVPFGIGIGLMAGLIQIIVLTGLHGIVSLAILSEMLGENAPGSLINSGTTMAVFAQLGAAIGVLIKTKNLNLKKACIAALPAGFFGITEPIIYGVNLPKLKPFLYGCLAGFIGGVFVGIFGVRTYAPANGVFAILTTVQGGPVKVAIFVIGILLSLALGALFVVFLWNERPNENLQTKKLLKKIENYLKVNYPGVDTTSLSLHLEKLKTILTPEEMSNIKVLEKNLIKMQAMELKEKYYTNLLNKQKQKYANLAQKAYEKNNSELMLSFNEKFNNIKATDKIKDIINKKNALEINNEQLTNKYEQTQKRYLQETQSVVDKIKALTKNDDIIQINNAFHNIINSLYINFEIVDFVPETFKFKKIKGVVNHGINK